MRKEGDSNPRYRYQYNTLAGCRFQPLSHLSKRTSGKFISIMMFHKLFLFLFFIKEKKCNSYFIIGMLYLHESNP